jgi:hypothetical protein
MRIVANINEIRRPMGAAIMRSVANQFVITFSVPAQDSAFR